MYRISTLSEVFIQWKDLHVRIETPTARSAGGVSIRTSRSFHWMDIEDKVDIRLTHRIATLTVNVYRMESQIRCNIFTQVNVLLHFPSYCLVSKIKFYTKCKMRRGYRYILGIIIIISPIKKNSCYPSLESARRNGSNEGS